MEVNDKCIDLIVKHAGEYKPHKPCTGSSNKYYLAHTIDVLGDVVSLKSLIETNTEVIVDFIIKSLTGYISNGLEITYMKIHSMNDLISFISLYRVSSLICLVLSLTLFTDIFVKYGRLD